MIQPEAGDAKVVVTDVGANQIGLGKIEGTTLTNSLVKVLHSAETADINTLEWIKEANAVTELCLLPQAILNSNEKEISLNYKLFKGELSAEIDLVFESLREWVIQVPHGDHMGADKMHHLTESVYWPRKANDLRQKAKNSLTW